MWSDKTCPKAQGGKPRLEVQRSPKQDIENPPRRVVQGDKLSVRNKFQPKILRIVGVIFVYL